MIVVFVLFLFLLLVVVLVDLAGLRLHPPVELADHQLVPQDLAEVDLRLCLFGFGELS